MSGSGVVRAKLQLCSPGAKPRTGSSVRRNDCREMESPPLISDLDVSGGRVTVGNGASQASVPTYIRESHFVISTVVVWRIACSYLGVDLQEKIFLVGRWESGVLCALGGFSNKLSPRHVGEITFLVLYFLHNMFCFAYS